MNGSEGLVQQRVSDVTGWDSAQSFFQLKENVDSSMKSVFRLYACCSSHLFSSDLLLYPTEEVDHADVGWRL